MNNSLQYIINMRIITVYSSGSNDTKDDDIIADSAYLHLAASFDSGALGAKTHAT